MPVKDSDAVRLLKSQQDEINAHSLYTKVAARIKDKRNRDIIIKMADDELAHYKAIALITGRTLRPQKIRMFILYWIIRIFGFTFGIKLFEKAESDAIEGYAEHDGSPEFQKIAKDEEKHEEELIAMLDEEKLKYMGSVVLGLNDALVELTGALAGYTFAFQNTRLIALTGLITGISASLSMAASEYLSTRHEGGGNALKSSLYTGATYVLTVIFLVLPFIFLKDHFISLAATILVAVIIIFLFNYYISVAKDLDFKKRFLEMASISLGVAAVSFLIGMLVKQFIGIEI